MHVLLISDYIVSHVELLFTQIVFCSMIISGYKRPLVDNDLFDLNRDDKASRVSNRFLRIWNAEKKKYA